MDRLSWIGLITCTPAILHIVIGLYLVAWHHKSPSRVPYSLAPCWLFLHLSWWFTARDHWSPRAAAWFSALHKRWHAVIRHRDWWTTHHGWQGPDCEVRRCRCGSHLYRWRPGAVQAIPRARVRHPQEVPILRAAVLMMILCGGARADFEPKDPPPPGDKYSYPVARWYAEQRSLDYRKLSPRWYRRADVQAAGLSLIGAALFLWILGPVGSLRIEEDRDAGE